MSRYTAVLFAVVVMVSFLASGCNTIKGLGQDLQSGAEAMQQAIDGQFTSYNDNHDDYSRDRYSRNEDW